MSSTLIIGHPPQLENRLYLPPTCQQDRDTLTTPQHKLSFEGSGSVFFLPHLYGVKIKKSPIEWLREKVLLKPPHAKYRI